MMFTSESYFELSQCVTDAYDKSGVPEELFLQAHKFQGYQACRSSVVEGMSPVWGFSLHFLFVPWFKCRFLKARSAASDVELLVKTGLDILFWSPEN